MNKINSHRHSIVFYETEAEHEEFYRDNLAGNDLTFISEELNANNVNTATNADIISVFIYSNINKEILMQLPGLKLISTRSTGYDHIDINETKKRNIEIANVPIYGENTVAEHTMALILSLFHNIHKAYIRSTTGKFNYQGLMGRDLKGKTLGILGGGHIGMHVARMAKAFGLEVQVYDVQHRNFLAEVMDFKYVSLDELISSSDIISLHLPLNKATTHFIDWEKIQKMKKGVVLINTARGALVDTSALIKGLDSGIIDGAGLDVLEGEGLVKEEVQISLSTQDMNILRTLVENNILLHRDNVIITPHIAYYSFEAMQRIAEVTVENIKTFIEGEAENLIAA